VIRHSDVTAAGFGTHTDPGSNFPMDDFLDKGRWYAHNGWLFGVDVPPEAAAAAAALIAFLAGYITKEA
jgi:N-acetyl-anhydromuramyl-L-alanine amidase AmpD